jgi:cytochrome c oxidase subunit 1
MTATTTPRTAATGGPAPRPRKTLGSQVVRVLTSTDHKVIGKLYFSTAFVWFILAGIMALVIRTNAVLK